jgi:cytoskeletal protein RodZ
MGAGETWQKEREARGMTLDAASSALRVSRKYLRGIEEAEYSGWPERVFSSGYIRAYAKLLSQDPEPVLSEYYQFLEQRGVAQQPVQAKPEWLERERQRGNRRTTYALAAGVVLLIGIVLAWYGTRTATRPVPAPAPQARPAQAPAPAPAENAATAALPGGPDNATAVAPESVPATGPAAGGGPAPADAAPPSSVASVGGVGPVKSPYQLFIEASEMTWMMYTLDDEAPVDVMLYPGDKISIQARKKIFLKLGNAGGVVGTLNGKLLPPFGPRGQVKEVRLGE